MDGIQKKNVFFAYTPYHVFIALLMAVAMKGKEEQSLVIVGNFSDAEILYKALLTSPAKLFKDISFLSGEYNFDKQGFFKRKFLRYFGAKQICNDLVAYIKTNGIDKVFLFNEDRPYSLAVLNHIEKTNRKVRTAFVEDGAVSYNSYCVRKKWHYILFGKIFYGSWWEDHPIMGGSPIFDEIWAFFPDFIRPEIANKPLKRIPLAGMAELRENRVAQHILAAYGVNPDDLESLNCVILLSHSTIIAEFPEYKTMLLTIIQKAQSLGYNVALKYHPRDDADSDFLGINGQANITSLRASAPLELIFLLARNNIKLVVSDLSTVALSARLILDDAQVVSAGVLLGSKDERFLKMLDAQGVKLPKSFEEFNQYV